MESPPPLRIMPRAVSASHGKKCKGLTVFLCPNCKLRKIRCDRSIPCSSCLSSGLTCRSSAKSRAEPTPVTSTTNNDHQFQRLHDRLASIEDAINRISDKDNIGAGSSLSRPQHVFNAGPEHEPMPVDDDSSRFPEGDSSFGRQTVVASQIAELAGAQCGSSSVLARELNSFKSLLEENRAFQRSSYLHSARPKPPPSTHELLPSSFVLKLLRNVDDGKPYLFTFYGLHDRKQIEEVCTKVYFPIQPASPTEVTLCHGMLSTLLRDPLTLAHHELNTEDATKYLEICESAFQAGVESYEVVAVPTFENALILSLAMSHAQSEAKLPLQWTLTSVAARHCLALGYHREERLSQLPSLKAERARSLFWHIYTSDKNLSSRLGRASVIQDYDLDTKSCSVSNDPGRAPWDQASVLFAELSRTQGTIYEALYSASAANLDSAQGNHIASSLADKLSKWHDEWREIDKSGAYQREHFEHVFGPVDIVYYSVLTLLHRGATSSKSILNTSPACLQAAYSCLNAHLAYSSSLQLPPPYIPGYAIWLFNFTSFTAFTVIFTNCVVNESSSDLELLRKVLLSLEQIAVCFEYSKWQFNLCNGLYRIADAFIRLRQEDGVGTGADLQDPFVGGWSWLDTNLSSMLEMGGQMNGMEHM